MNADALVKAMIAYGADEAGIRDRFGGNAELYELCFHDFLEGAYLPALADAMREKDYTAAFEAAHAIKGLPGNLGLNPYYRAICVLVESLRAQRYDHVDEDFAETERQLGVIRRIYAAASDGPNTATPPIPDGADDTLPPDGAEALPQESADTRRPTERNRAKKGKKERFIPIASGIVLLTIVLLFFLFQNIIAKYQRNATIESAGHLVEINYQLKKYVEDQVENDWLTAYTVKSYIARCGKAEGDADIRSIMRELEALWKVSHIILYTDDGFSINADGEMEANDVASELVTEAYLQGEYLRIMESDLTYTVPVDTELVYNGSRVSAVSVVKSMASFLDEMGFSAFDESAQVYLCNENGSVISRLSTENAAITFNVLSLIKEEALKTVEGGPADPAALTKGQAPATYLHNDDYFVFTPVETRSETFFLAYFVPESIVNKTRNSFSGNIVTTSLLVVALFAAVALLTVVYINRIRKRQLNEALLTREHLFDLLVKGSQTGFVLFEDGDPSPAFVSSNFSTIVGEEIPVLCKTEAGYELQSGTGGGAPAFAAVNETLRGWDGKGVFRSRFIKNSKARPANYFEVQLMSAAGESGEYIGIAQDVTLLHERDVATREALKMAEQASEAKSRFLSNMSHDIRTPMNAIVNMTDFAIEDMANPDRLRGHLKTIRESSDHLLLLINDILDMSRIESGNTFIDAAPFNLLAELDRLKSITASLCASKHQMLIADFSGIQTPGVLGDRAKVSQILMNLLSNAVKFTPQNGGVRFAAEELPSMREESVHLRFTVEDNGIGISEAFLPYIFSPFSRENDSRVSGIQGTGLGLSICHSYVVAMGGDIQCHSEEGEGTVFTVELYLGKTEAPPDVKEEVTSMDVAPFRGMHCLLCEDNETNQKIARTLLERLGFRVDIAGDGSDGVKTFRKSPLWYYDVIYMDIQMPVMDGYEATVGIRKSVRPDAGAVPIIAMSANVFIEDIEKAHIAGMNGHVGKPISTVAVANETQKALNNRRSML